VKKTDVSAVSVQRTWRAGGLTSHRMKTFKLPNNPKFAQELSVN
jgi:hypothetical protein